MVITDAYHNELTSTANLMGKRFPRMERNIISDLFVISTAKMRETVRAVEECV